MKTLMKNLFLLFAVTSICFPITNAQTPTATPAEPEAERRAVIKKLNAEAMGLFLMPTGDSLRAAREKFRVVQDYYLKNGEKRLAASTLVFTGRISHQLGDYAAALDSLNQAVSLWREIGDQKWEALTLVPLSFVYDALGKDEKAFEIYLRVQLLGRATGNKIVEAQALRNIGGAYFDRREYTKSLEHYQSALLLYQAVGAGQNEMGTLGDIGFTHFKLGERAQALEYMQKALLLSRSLGDKAVEATLLSYIGLVYMNIDGEKTKALENFQQALILRRVGGSKRAEASMLAVLQNYWQVSGNPRLAIFYGKQSVNIYQELRQAIQTLDRETQKTFLKSFQNIYQKLADLLVAEGRFAEAQQVLGLLKEEEYFQYVRRDADEIKKLTGSVKLKTEEQKLIERYNLLADKVTGIGAEFQKLDDKKRKLPEGAFLSAQEQTRYDELVAQLTDANAAFRLFLEKELLEELGKSVKKEIDVDRSLQKKLREWGAGTVALYTIAGEDRYRVILTTPTVQIDGKTEIKAAELNRKIFEFRSALQDTSIDPRPLGKELYDILIKPIEKDLRAANAKTLIWSLDGTLRYIPLAALSPDGKTYLVEKYQTALITSATRQNLTTENETGWRTLGLGVTGAQTVTDPVLLDEKIKFSELPGVREELRTIVKDENTPNEKGWLSGRRLVDAEFNQKNFGDSLTKINADGKRKYTVVHIASHFRLGDDAANSFLLLGDGMTLTLDQISNSPQMEFGNVELVTLSACNTAFGDDTTGKEVDSLATFIELRGAKAIMATLWAVADESTSLLMSEFYRLHKENPQISKAEAMQKSQKAMIDGVIKAAVESDGCRPFIDSGVKQTPFKCEKNAPFAHPYFWSPFILIGNWR